MAPKTVRIQDVAQAARVSTATVSRALSDPDKLSERTRAVVFEAIRTTGYRVNQAARNLRMRRAGAILILVPNLGNPFFSQILAGITASFAKSDYSVLITDTLGHPDKGRAYVDYFLDSRIDGMISLDGSLTEDDLAFFRRSGVADRIVFACEWVHGASYPSVRSDNVAGARMAIRHLHDLGHRKIAHIAGPQGNVLTHARLDGMLAETEKLGLPYNNQWIIPGDFTLQSGHDAAGRILDMPNRPTAVFCASDMVAFGLISGLAAAGVKVPEDISVVGFDDIEMSGHYVPALTTVSQDRRHLGLRAAELLLDHLNQDPGDPWIWEAEPELLSVTLNIRDSTAAPPPG